MLRKNIIFIFLCLNSLVWVRSAEAVTIPSFPSCINPQGVVQASYSDGTHGIIGNTATFTGSDSVYTVSENQDTQCFCDNSGEGTQTNWLKANTLSESDINELKSQGWIFIPDGSFWGLSATPFMALNSNFQCVNNSGSNSGGSTTSDTGGTGNVSSGNSTGEILAAFTTNPSVLAATGENVMLYGVGAGALGFILIGLYLFINIKKK